MQAWSNPGIATGEGTQLSHLLKLWGSGPERQVEITRSGQKRERELHAEISRRKRTDIIGAAGSVLTIFSIRGPLRRSRFYPSLALRKALTRSANPVAAL
jgi:hypothetical protein